MSLCELCTSQEQQVVVQQEEWRIVLIKDINYPGYCQVVWTEHVKEMSDLNGAQKTRFMDVVWRVESAIRQVMQPEKINLASLGNMTPHLHWHIIPRYCDDMHYPKPIWGRATKIPSKVTLDARRALLPALRAALVKEFE